MTKKTQMRGPNDVYPRFAQIIALLIAKERTVPEIMRIAEAGRKSVGGILNALLAEGLVARRHCKLPGWGGGRIPDVWSWVAVKKGD